MYESALGTITIVCNSYSMSNVQHVLLGLCFEHILPLWMCIAVLNLKFIENGDYSKAWCLMLKRLLSDAEAAQSRVEAGLPVSQQDYN